MLWLVKYNLREAVTRRSLDREFEVQILGLVEMGRVLATARHRSDISSKGALLPAGAKLCPAEIGPASLLHASA